ncbi:MAG: YggT family protein [Anaerolineae bacterium]
MATFLIRFISILFELLNLAIIARVFLSWFNVRPDHPMVSFLYQVTEPVLAPIRRVVPTIGMLDISPIIAIILLELLRNLLISVVANIF